MGCQFSDMNSMMQLNSDTVDKNHFVSTGILGEGGFGRVVAAMHVKSGNWYAVKEINKFELVKHKCGVSMIFGELSAMKKLDYHPFIINLQVAFQDRRHCFLALDLKTGGDLRYYLRKRYLFDERDCAFYVACLSSALDHIHSKNIIHRDVKPENIILDERGYPYLTDFGVAHVQNDPWDKTLTCNLASGTKQYLAPEVFCKTHIHGPEVDYWSLGVVIYEILFGRRPFDKHCPINFIHYLEKALSLKRKYLKEMKMRELSQSMDHMVIPAISGHRNGSGSGETTRQNSSSTLILSPTKDSQMTMVMDSPNKIQQKLPGILSSPAKTSQSTDYSTWEKESSALYCSSAGYSSQDGLMKRGGTPLSACGPDTLERTDSMSSPQKSKSKEKFLPELKPSSSLNNLQGSNANSPPKLLWKRNPSVYPGGFNDSNDHDHAGDGKGIAYHHSEGTQGFGSTSGDSTEGSPHSSQTPTRALPGDHWLVDEGDLPAALVVHIPVTNPWLGILSQECIEVLSGLFEVRPSYRYGCRNIQKLRYSAWLEAYKLSDWDQLGKKKYNPRFQPGKKFIKDTLNRIEDISQARLLGSPITHSTDAVGTTHEEENEIISSEQEELFKEFYYVSRVFTGQSLLEDNGGKVPVSNLRGEATVSHQTRKASSAKVHSKPQYA